MSENPILIICGPTATGKTDLGIKLAQKFNGEIISADSRQIYQGMNVGTGKSLPGNSKFEIRNSKNGLTIGYYMVNGIKIWGYDLARPDQDFSVAHFQQFASLVIADIRSRGKLPIVVGGTGLYLKSLTENLETITIPPNQQLRLQLEQLSVNDLQEQLRHIDPDKFDSMNHSDQLNPRRLIRAIEIQTYRQQLPLGHHALIHLERFDPLWIGLTAPMKILDTKVAANVTRRSQKLTLEINHLLSTYPLFWSYPSASATGYHQWQQFIQGKISRSEAIKLWITAETGYLRRQLTWFRKQSQIHWFDISQSDFQTQVEHLVKDWYSNHSS